jgi:hypothetical protein
MQRILILAFCIIPFVSRAQHDVLVLEKRGMHVRSYTIGDPFTFETVYGQWFNGVIDDLHRDTVYINGQAFSYKEIAAISREKTKWNNRTTGVLLTTAGVGFFAIGAANGGLRGDKAKEWYTTSGLIIGGALITSGVLLVATAKKYYPLGGRFKLQYLQIGR